MVEVMPSATRQGVALLKELRTASLKDDGNLRFHVVQETSRPNRFAILEIWKDQKAFEAHGKAAHAVKFRSDLAPIYNSPSDERVHNALVAATAAAPSAKRAVWVATHVDVPPPRKDEAIVLLKTLTEESRKDGGNLMFDVVQQTSRPNHFTVVEVWKDKKIFDAHLVAAATRQFREKLTPMSGALYDERVYRAVD